jgi:hypothetical protein
LGNDKKKFDHSINGGDQAIVDRMTKHFQMMTKRFPSDD